MRQVEIWQKGSYSNAFNYVSESYLDVVRALKNVERSHFLDRYNKSGKTQQCCRIWAFQGVP